MKPLFAFLVLLFISTVSSAQASAKHQDNLSAKFFKKLKPAYLSAASLDSPITIRNFSGISFMDARFDTSAVGYTLVKGHFEKLVPKLGLGNYLSKCFNIILDNNARPELMCVVHNFRIIEADSLHGKDEVQVQTGNRMVVKIDAFVSSNDQYRAAFRLDTTILDFASKAAYKDHVISLLLRSLQARIDNINLERVQQKKAYSLVEIKETVSGKFELPILVDSTYKRGVYLTFKEFINNNPSFKDYSIRKKDLLDDIYLKDADSSTAYLATKVFGYSDGNKVWIKYRDNFFLLHRNENAYQFFGFATGKMINRLMIVDANAFFSASSVPLPSFSSQTLDMSLLRPFMLDMEKGGIL